MDKLDDKLDALTALLGWIDSLPGTPMRKMIDLYLWVDTFPAPPADNYDDLLERLRQFYDANPEAPLDFVVELCKRAKIPLPQWAQDLMFRQLQPKKPRRGAHARIEQRVLQRYQDLVCLVVVRWVRLQGLKWKQRDEHEDRYPVYEEAGKRMHLSPSALKRTYHRVLRAIKNDPRPELSALLGDDPSKW